MHRSCLRRLVLVGVLCGAAQLSGFAGAPPTPQGFITYRTYPGDPRADVRDLKGSPDGIFYPKRAEGPYNGINSETGDDPGDDDTRPPGDVRNNYIMELIGYFYPPKTGKLQLAIASDDPGELFLSTDDSPANKKLLAREPSWNGIRAFSAESRRTMVETGDPPVPRLVNQSAWINVEAGKPYFLQAFATEFGGGDNLAVAFRFEGDPDFADGDLPILGKFLSSFDRATVADVYASKFSSSPSGFSLDLHDGDGAGAASANAASVKATLDGAAITVAAAKTGNIVRVTFTKPDGFFTSQSKHTAKVDFADTAGKAGSVTKEFTVGRFGLLTANERVQADTSKPGFLWRVHQNNANTQNSNTKTERALSGALDLPNLADSSAQGGANGPGKVIPGAAGLIEFEVSTFINFDQGAGSNGAFQPDEQMPGIPGVEGSTDGIAAEIITFLDLPKGLVRMGVNSDDGFKTTAGNVNDAFANIFLGEFNGGRGAADTIFDFLVAEAGVYPFRTIWEEGGGGANIEWFTFKADGTKVLVNDTANGGIKAFRAASAASLKPAIKATFPAVPATPGPGPRPEIGALIIEAGATVDQASVVLTVNGQAVKPTITKTGSELKILFTPTTDFAPASKVAASLTFKDSTGASRTESWSWQTAITTAIFTAGTLFIEAEDVDFGKGKFVTDKKIGMDGAYEGAAYKDLGTAEDKGFDWFTNDNAGQAYRPDTGIAAGKENGSATKERGTFEVTTWWTLGWNDGNEWYNYTRNFPTPAKDYAVYGNLSSGGAAINIRLDQITAGQGQADAAQVKKTLGFFTPKRATPGWDSLEIFQLTDVDGNPITVNLGGNVTLRTTILPGSNSDQDYFAFLPSAPIGPGPGTGAKLTASRTGNTVRIEWTGGGTLESADAVTGPWTAVAGASSPATVTITGTGKFYRVKQ